MSSLDLPVHRDITRLPRLSPGCNGVESLEVVNDSPIGCSSAGDATNHRSVPPIRSFRKRSSAAGWARSAITSSSCHWISTPRGRKVSRRKRRGLQLKAATARRARARTTPIQRLIARWRFRASARWPKHAVVRRACFHHQPWKRAAINDKVRLFAKLGAVLIEANSAAPISYGLWGAKPDGCSAQDMSPQLVSSSVPALILTVVGPSLCV